MEIETEVTITDTVKIHISADEAMSAILEPPEAGGYRFTNYLQRIAGSMRAIPDELIEALTPEQKRVVSDFLTEQAARYAI